MADPITITPSIERYAYLDSYGRPGAWAAYAKAPPYYAIGVGNIGVVFEIPNKLTGTLTGLSLTIATGGYLSENHNLYTVLSIGDSYETATQMAYGYPVNTGTEPSSLSPRFAPLYDSNLQAKTLYLAITPSQTQESIQVDARDLTLQGTFGNLSISIAPSTVTLGASVTMSFENRLWRPLTLQYKSGSTVLDQETVDSDSHSKTPPASWYETAGQTGANLSVSVSVSDSEGRTASGNFTVQKPQSLSVTATAPRSTTKEGSEAIQFAWTVSGTWGTQTRAELQYSTDNINWIALATVTGDGATTMIPAKTFPPGTVYWRVRVLNSYNVWSAWSSAVSFTVAYAATSYVEPLNSPTGGYIDATLAQGFGVSMLANGTPYVPFEVASATLHWRSSASDPWTDAAMTPSGSTASVTVPANTFPAGTLYWYASAVDQYGGESQTGIYSVSTLASAIDAQPVAPSGTIEMRNTSTVFIWRYATITGSEQTAAELQYSTDGSSWLDLGSVTGSATTFTAAADAIPSGTIYWRVRAENAEGVWGPWSDPASYINLGAPDVSSVQADSKPYTTIVWQVDTQEAYRITVDGVQIVQAYGDSVRSFTLPQPLADGLHTVSVQAQNRYGQWSAPRGTSFEVQNVPGAPVELSALFARDAELSWETADETSDFYILRDDVPIGHTSGQAFADRAVLGFHTWQVINKLPGGYYTASDAVSGTLCTPVITVAPLSGGEWLDLELSENPIRSTSAAQGQTVTLRQFAGREYPDAEAAPYKTLQVSFDVSFPTAKRAQARAFEALMGRAVIFKEPGEEALVGILGGFQRQHTQTARSYTATLQRIHWRDFVDADS